MRDTAKRSVKEGIGFGIVAGIIFAFMEIARAAMMGDPPLMPVRMFASVLLGKAALETVSGGTALLVGTFAHLALSALFGLVYTGINGRFSEESRTRWGRQALIGLSFGIALWLVNFQIIARLIYPWFLMTPQFLQMAMHAMAFGLPLGLFYAGAERRVSHFRPLPTTA